MRFQWDCYYHNSATIAQNIISRRVEALGVCQIPTCVRDDMAYHGGCVHHYEHKRDTPICLYDSYNASTIVSFTDSCARYARNKKLIVCKTDLLNFRFNNVKV